MWVLDEPFSNSVWKAHSQKQDLTICGSKVHKAHLTRIPILEIWKRRDI